MEHFALVAGCIISFIVSDKISFKKPVQKLEGKGKKKPLKKKLILKIQIYLIKLWEVTMLHVFLVFNLLL
jgi:hypothetical protein